MRVSAFRLSLKEPASSKRSIPIRSASQQRLASQRICRRGSGGGGATAPSPTRGRPQSPSRHLPTKRSTSPASGTWTVRETPRPLRRLHDTSHAGLPSPAQPARVMSATTMICRSQRITTKFVASAGRMRRPRRSKIQPCRLRALLRPCRQAIPVDLLRADTNCVIEVL